MNAQLTVNGPSGEPGSHVPHHVVVVLKCPVDHVVNLRPRLEELTVKGKACALVHVTKMNALVNNKAITPYSFKH